MYHEHNLGPFWLIGAIIVIIPFWRLCQRAGYSPWLSLLMALPLVNLIFLYFLAFSEWPSRKGTVASGAA